ncbi:uncharacterized protein LOC131304580 isoform X3 [Rhododendron vialii]|uniref:uncharacterized protein LOC131304580 isoform X3 n=1 Tax=Rhododendron vialii TaxID=182163 RepID=UPI0026601774|nr:uncharacterized protein LOC131304580 isoform X3 [Rhododendron vialii]
MTLLRKFELESERHTQFSTEPFVLNFAPEVDIAAGGWHSTALTNDGEVYGWGRGEHGRLGFGNDKSSIMVPQMVQLLVEEDIIQVTMGVVVIPRRCP